MSQTETQPKIKLPAKSLTRNQVWNVVVRVFPWAVIFTAIVLISGMKIGAWETQNQLDHDTAIKTAAVAQLK